MTNNEDEYLNMVKEEIDEYLKKNLYSKMPKRSTTREEEIERLEKVIANIDMRKTKLEKKLFDLKNKDC